jgi:thiamine biosynthesis lipoprotein
MSGISGDQRLYSYSAVLMGSPILLKLFSHDEALASRTFQLIKRYEDLFTVNRAHSEVMGLIMPPVAIRSASAARFIS